jgi:hypothetical protein
VIVLESGPVYNVFMTGIRGGSLSGIQWVWLLASFSVVFLLCFAATAIPIRLGEKRISLYEFGSYKIN